jgi:hypothetical protein
MFGDGAWLSARSDRQEARLARWLAHATQVVVVEVGAGTDVPSVRHVVAQLGMLPDAALIRINPREPAVSGRRDLAIAAPALQALQAMDRALESA